MLLQPYRSPIGPVSGAAAPGREADGGGRNGGGRLSRSTHTLRGTDGGQAAAPQALKFPAASKPNGLAHLLTEFSPLLDRVICLV